MPQYEWHGDGEFQDNWNGRTVEPGEVVDLPEQVGDPQPEFVRVDGESGDSGPAAGGEGAGVDEEEREQPAAPLDPDELNVDELEAALAEGNFSDDELEAIAAAEERGRDRTTALEAIEGAAE